MITHEMIKNLPVYYLKGLAGSKLTALNQGQMLLIPHLYLLKSFWWCTYIGVLTYMASRFILIPLLQNALTHQANNPKTPKRQTAAARKPR